MKYNFLQLIIRGLAGAVFFFFVFDAITTSAYSQDLTDRQVLEKYYRLLESIQTDSSGEQISALQGFLQDHSTFERVYLKLFERYLFFDRIQGAKAYFQQLTSTPQCRRNSLWVLAKLFIIENEPQAAFQAFSAALQAGTPLLSLLKDFIEFDRQQAGRFGGATVLGQLGMKPEMQKIVSAFYCYQKLACEQAIKEITTLPQKSSHNSVVLHLWGECFYRLARNAKADSLWRIGLAISQTTGDWEGEAQFLTNLGILSGVSNKYDEELKFYDSAYGIASRVGDLQRMQLISGLRAFSYFDRGDYSAAIKQADKAISIAEKIRAYRYLASWSLIYGDALRFMGEYDEALNAYDKSDEYARKGNDELRLIEIKLAKGKTYHYLKQYAIANKVLQEAFTLAEAKSLNEKQQEIKVKIADLLLIEGKYAEAKQIYQEIIKTQNNLIERAYAIGRLAKVSKLEGHYNLAKKEYLRALATAQEAGSETYQGWYLLFIGDMEVMLGDIADAIPRYHLAREIATKQKNTEMLWQVYLSYGNAYKKVSDVNAAITAYQQAIGIIEAARKGLKVDQLRIGYFREGNQVYRNLVQCFLQRYETQGNRADLDSLFYYDEMGRGRALQDLKQWEKTLTHSQEFLQARDKVRRMQHRLRLEADRLRLPEELNHLLSELEAARYSLLAQRLRGGEGKPSSEPSVALAAPALPKVLQELQREKMGLLLYHISQDGSFVLATDGEQAKVVRLPLQPCLLRADIDSLMGPLHYVKDDSVQYTRFRAKLAHRLYQSLVKPAEAALTLPQRLLIVPDLELMNLPFEMLLVNPPKNSDYTPSDFPDYADDFLVHRYTFVYSPSASLLTERANVHPENSCVLVFANPVDGAPQPENKKNSLRALTGWRFDPLPYAEVEAQRIKEIQPQAQVNKRRRAAKAAFLQEAPQHQIVHLATHAFVDTTFDAFSGLVLAVGNDSTDDGMLMGYEISDLNLNCDLITLSACETGRGEAVAGEGVLGLPRLFLGAGAKSVLMTLWKVDDKLTSELMPAFYENLLNRKLSKADALSQAKRVMLDRKYDNEKIYRQHPFYWAAFVLFGDANTIPSRTTAARKLGILLLTVLIIAIIGVFSYRHFRQR